MSVIDVKLRNISYKEKILFNLMIFLALVRGADFIQHGKNGFFDPVLFRESDEVSSPRYHLNIKGGDIR